MNPKNSFKWRHFKDDIILQGVRWYNRYSLSYREVEELMLERGVKVDHTTVFRWVQEYNPELDKRCRDHIGRSNDSWRVDETYIKVKGKWKYLYRAIDSQGRTLDFLLTAKRDAKAAKRFLAKVLNAWHSSKPRVINVDKAKAYPKAVADLKEEGLLPEDTVLRQQKYLNNVIEQDHRFIKRRIQPMLGFKSFHTAWRTLRGIEVMHLIRKGQIHGVAKGDVLAQRDFIAQLFALAA